MKKVEEHGYRNAEDDGWLVGGVNEAGDEAGEKEGDEPGDDDDHRHDLQINIFTLMQTLKF